MRIKTLLWMAVLPLLLVMTGCGMGTHSTLSSADPVSAAFTGNVHGGNIPITGATVNVYSVGTGGYGSAATILDTCGGPCTTTTDDNGGFSFSTFSCPQPDTPIYVLTIGGNTGAGDNDQVVLGTGLGDCASLVSYVQVNEITTISLAYAMAQFFNGFGGTPGTGDSFSGPSSNSSPNIVYSHGLTYANAVTIPQINNIQIGYVRYTYSQNNANVVVEGAKMVSLANSLAGCVNTHSGTGGVASSVCSTLFSDVQPAGGTLATDTLQAAVQMALNPNPGATKISSIIALAGSSPPFAGGLTGNPADLSVGISYTATSTMGLAVAPSTLSTIDIDVNGNVWFPSNLSGHAGVAEYTPGSLIFSGPFNGPGLVFPQQVAADAANQVWATDASSSTVGAFSISSPSTSNTYSLPGTVSSALTVADDDSINFAVYNSGTATPSIATIPTDRSSYSLITGSTLNYPATSLASDSVGGISIDTDNASTLYGYYLSPGPSLNPVSLSDNDSGAGQIVFTCPSGGCTSSGDFIALRPYSGGSTPSDGICAFSTGSCYSLTPSTTNGVLGAAIDGNGTLWMTEPGDGGVLYAPQVTSSAPFYTTTSIVAANELLHNSTNGATMTSPAGIAIDTAGDVWVSNAGCTTSGCTPGSFTLSEIIGAAAPTITPVVQQIITNSTLTSTKPSY